MDDPANNVSDEKWALLVEDTRILLRDFAGRKGQPTAVCLDSRTCSRPLGYPTLPLFPIPSCWTENRFFAGELFRYKLHN
jgi:hypothetical protein